MTFKVLGMDPGLTGGLALLEDGKIIDKVKMPIRIKNKEGKNEVDLIEVSRIVNEWKPDLIVLERANPRPGEGVTSAFTSGMNWGYVRTVFELWGTIDKLVLVHPRVWASALHISTIEQEPDAKKRSLEAVKKYFPNENFLATLRSSKPHEGIVDAVALALWGHLYGLAWKERESKKPVRKKSKKKVGKNVRKK